MELALDAQRAFWKFVGVLTIVMIGLSLLGIAAAIAVPAFFRASMQ